MYSVNRGDGTSASGEKVLESELPISSTSSVDATKMIQVLNSFLDNVSFLLKNSSLDNFTLTWVSFLFSFFLTFVLWKYKPGHLQLIFSLFFFCFSFME